MDGFDQTQALEACSDEDAAPVPNGDDKKPVGTLKVLTRNGYKEAFYPIRRGKNTLGRLIDICQIHIPTKVLSKRHAVIEVDGDTHCIYDIGSHNKSFLGEMCLKPHVPYGLRDGDTLKFANILCEYYKSDFTLAHDNDESGSTADSTEAVVAGPTNRSKLALLSKKVQATHHDTEVQMPSKGDNPEKEFELKSDSEVEDNDDSKGDLSAQIILAPETPYAPPNDRKELHSLNSCSHPSSPDVFPESDLDTDIEEEHSKYDYTLKTKAIDKPAGTNAESDIEGENMRTQALIIPDEKSSKAIDRPEATNAESDIDWADMQTQAFIMPDEKSSKAIDRPAATNAESDIDWEDMQTQAFTIPDEKSKEILNADTQIYPNLAQTLQIDKPSTPEKQKIDHQCILPSVVDHFISQNSDSDINTVQAAVAKVLGSNALNDSPLNTRLNTRKVPSTISSEIDEIFVPGIKEMPITSKDGVSEKRAANNDRASTVNSENSDAESELSSHVFDAATGSSPETKHRRLNTRKRNVTPRLAVEEKPCENETAIHVEDESGRKNEDVVLETSASNTRLGSLTRRKRKGIDSSNLKENSEDEQKNNVNASVACRSKLGSKSKLMTRRKRIDTLSSNETDEEIKSSRNRPTAPNLLISLGSSPTCKMMDDPHMDGNIVSAASDTLPSTSSTVHYKFKKLSVLSKSKAAFSTLPTPVQLSNEVGINTPEPTILTKDKAKKSRITKNVKIANDSIKDINDVGEDNEGELEESVSPLRRSSRTRSKSASLVPQAEPVKPLDKKELKKSNKRKRGAAVDSDKEEKQDVKDSPSSHEKTLKTQQKQSGRGENSKKLNLDDDDDDDAADNDDETNFKNQDKIPERQTRSTSRSRRSASSKSPSTSASSLAANEDSIDTSPVTTKRKRRKTSKSLQISEASGKDQIEHAQEQDAKDSTIEMQTNETEDLPKVMFTGLCDAKLEKGEPFEEIPEIILDIITDLGGIIVDSVFDCTHLITEKVRRTVKFLCILARGKPIVDIDWIKQCKRSRRFIDCSPFIVKDKSTEKQYSFILTESLQKANQRGLLEEFSIHITPSVMPEPNDMKLIIQCAKGKHLKSMPRNLMDGVRATIIISCKNDYALCYAAIRKKIPVVTSEFILTGILQQKVDIESTLIKM